MRRGAMKINFKLVSLLFLVLLIVACAPKDFSPFEKKIYTTTQTLYAAVEFRHLGLSVVGDLYKKDLIQEEEKEKFISLGDELYKIITSSQIALELYYKTGISTNLEEKLLLYTQIYGKFSDLVMPYILKHYEEN
jgi:hypothetical protein